MAQSYYHNPRCTPYQYATIPACLKDLADSRPDKAAVIVRYIDKPRQQLTFSELYQSANRFANGLWNLGVRKGSKVGLFVRNSIEWMIAFYGIVMTGAIAITAMSFHPETCMTSAMKIGCCLMILDARDISSREEIKLLVDTLTQKAINVKFDIKKLVLIQGSIKTESILDYQDLAEDNHPSSTNMTLDPDDVCFTMPTSGSSGKSKYVLHSHFSTINASATLANSIGVSQEDTYFSDRPMGYSGGYPRFLLPYGVTHLYCETYSTATPEITEFILDVIQEEKVTGSLIMPYLLHDLLKFERSHDKTPRLKRAMIGGQMVNMKMMEDLCRFAEEPIFIYGMTEMLCYFIASNRQLLQMQESRLGGFPREGIEVKIINDDGRIVPFGQTGEICMRCIYASRQYFMSDGTLKSALDCADWFHTADTGTMREDGYVIIDGRKIDMIKRGTAKIHPAAVEASLKDHPDVDEVCVVGVPDARLYEEVCACILPKPNCSLSEDTIRAFGNQVFQPELSPDRRGMMPGIFLIMEQIPRLVTGKVDKIKLKEICKQLMEPKMNLKRC